jgi:hypothetical protein
VLGQEPSFVLDCELLRVINLTLGSYLNPDHFSQCLQTFPLENLQHTTFGRRRSVWYSIGMSWKHLIRFKNKGQTSYGDAIFPEGSDTTDVVYSSMAGQLKARIILGDPLSAGSCVTDTIAQVDVLLTPLERAQVPIIRCIGLNYVKHSMCSAQVANDQRPSHMSHSV